MIELRITQAQKEHPAIFPIEKTIVAIENAVEEENSGLILGLCKSLIESFCYGVLDVYQKRNEVDGRSLKLKPLVAKVIQNLPKQATLTDKASRSFDALLNIHCEYLQKLIDISTEIGSIRNDYCPVSHGKAPWFQDLDFAHAEYALHITDSMLMLLYHCIEFDKQEESLDYRDDKLKEFNSYLDEQVTIKDNLVSIGESSFLPSQILFEMEPETYRIYYKEYLQEKEAQNESNK